MSTSNVPTVSVSAASLANMIHNVPLPGFGSLSETAQVTMLGVRYNIAPALRFRVVLLEGNLKEFSVFEKLPVEMQTKIWGFALESRTIVAVEITRPAGEEVSKLDDKKDDDRGKKEKPDGAPTESSEDVTNNAFRFAGAGCPEIFQVCKKVKELAGGMGYAPMFQVYGSRKMVYFNPYLDTLQLYTAPIRTGLAHQVALANALVNKVDLSNVRYLQVSLLGFLGHTFHDVLKDIKSMRSLKELRLSGASRVRPTNPQFTLQFRYEARDTGLRSIADVPGWGDNPLVTGGNHLTGAALVCIVANLCLILNLTHP